MVRTSSDTGAIRRGVMMRADSLRTTVNAGGASVRNDIMLAEHVVAETTCAESGHSAVDQASGLQRRPRGAGTLIAPIRQLDDVRDRRTRRIGRAGYGRVRALRDRGQPESP
jgi:hypothetical protein